MNRNLDIPKGFDRDLIKQAFPEAKPIFWGPNQSTEYPGEYNEPSGWRKFDLLSIPKVIRFITGGDNSITPAPFFTRFIYLGHTDTVNAFVSYRADPPNASDWIALGSFIVQREFALYEEVSVRANMSTVDVINQLAFTRALMRDDAINGVLSKYASTGPIPGIYGYLSGIGTAALAGKKYKNVINGSAMPLGLVPIGIDPFDYGFEPGNENKAWEGRDPSFTYYWFILNKYTGTYLGQQNYLGVINTIPGESPSSLGWPTVLVILGLYNDWHPLSGLLIDV